MFRILFLIWFSFHPVHVTITSIDYVPETDDFKGFIRLYLDDLLLDCQMHGYVVDQKKLLSPDTASLDMLEKYINEKLIIIINDVIVKGKLKDIKISDNEIDINILFANGEDPGSITVKNYIMTGLYEDQANMIIVKVADFEKGVKLTPDLTEQTFKIN